MDSTKFRWLFIGSGAIANKVANEITKSARHTVAAVYSTNSVSAKKLAYKYGARYYENLDDALNDISIEAVYIAVPHSGHYPLIKKCISHKKAVLCEKAFTVNYKQAQECIKLAKDNNVYLCEAMWTRFNPITVKINSMAKKGQLGGIFHFRASFAYNAKLINAPDRVLNKEKAGGALLDTGVYTIAYALMLFGEPDNIKVEAKFNNDGVDVEEIVEFEYKDGRTAILHNALNKFTLCRAEILATKAKIYFPFVFYKPAKAIVNFKSRRLHFICKRGYIYQFDKVASDIIAGHIESENMTHENTLMVMRVLDKIRTLMNLKYPDEIERLD